MKIIKFTYAKYMLKHFRYKIYSSDSYARDDRFTTDHLRCLPSNILKQKYYQLNEDI